MMAEPEPMATTAVAPEEDLKTAEDWKNEGNLLFKKGSFTAAASLYTQAIELDPSAATFYNNRAAAWLGASQFKKALADSLQCLRLDPLQPKAYFRAAKAQVHLGNLEDAVEQLKSLLLGLEKVRTAEGGLPSKSYLANKSSANKELADIKLISSKVDSFKVSLEAGNFFAALQNIENAMILLDHSLAGSGLPNSISQVDTNSMSKISPKWGLYRAEALIGVWDVNEAGQIARSILRQDSTNSEAIYIVAKSMYMLESHSISTINQYLSTALSYDPDNKNARVLFKFAKKLEAIKNTGNDAYKSSDWDAAIEAYNDFVEQDIYGGITKAKVLSNRAIVYSKQGNHSGVIDDVIAALEILDKLNFPNDFRKDEPVSNEDRANTQQSSLYTKLYLRRADSYTKLEQYEDAVRDYESASSVDSSNREIKMALNEAKKQLKMSKRKNYYKILGLAKDASSSEIKKAYRKAALQYHPDKQASLPEGERTEGEAKFKEIGEAYTVLSDERKKQMYDAGHDIDGESASGGGHNPFAGGGVNMQDLFSQFGGGAGFGGGGFGGHGHSHERYYE